MNHQQNNNQPSQFTAFMGWVVFVSRALSVSVEVFLHRNFGERYFGLQSVAAAAILFFYGAFWEGHDLRPLLLYLMFYLAMCFAARMDILRQKRRGGPQEHSRYSGKPWLMRRLTGRMSEEKVKSFVEVLLVFVVGVLTLPASEPLGSYLMLASAGLLVSTNVSKAFLRTRAMDMNDASMDQRQVTERFRDMRGD